MNEYSASIANTEQKFAVPANRHAGENDIAFTSTVQKTMRGRFQDVEDLVCRIEVAIAVAA